MRRYRKDLRSSAEMSRGVSRWLTEIIWQKVCDMCQMNRVRDNCFFHSLGKTSKLSTAECTVPGFAGSQGMVRPLLAFHSIHRECQGVVDLQRLNMCVPPIGIYIQQKLLKVTDLGLKMSPVVWASGLLPPAAEFVPKPDKRFRRKGRFKVSHSVIYS